MRSFAHTLLTIAFIAAFFVVPGLAQHGAAGGAHYSAPGAYFSNPAAHGTQPIGGGRNYPVRSYGPPPLGLRAPAAGYTGIDPGAYKSYGGFYRHRDYRNGAYPFLYTPYYYPFLGYSDSGYDAYPPPYDAGTDPAMQADLTNQNMLGEQIQQLAAEVDELRNQQQANGQPQGSTPSAAPSEPTQTPPAPPVTLVLRTGQHMTVQSYAIVDQMFWDLTSPTPRKIPLSTIDIPASTKATEASGGVFPQVTGGE